MSPRTSIRSTRPLHYLSFACALGAFGWLSVAHAGPAEDSLKLADQAMNEDFLATDFKGALKKLKTALKKCAKCENPVKARLYRDLGLLYATGFNNKGAALVNFQKAVKLDKAVTLPRAYASEDVKKLFLKAGGRKETLLHDAVNEQKKNTPVPIYAELLGEVPDAVLTVHYRVEGQKVFKELAMDSRSGGFGAYLPCESVLNKDSIEYYVTVNRADKLVSTSGSEELPFKVEMAEEIDGEVRSLPGDSEPQSCAKPVTPDLDDDDLDDEPPPPEEEPKRKHKNVWVSLGVQKDLALVGGTDICTSSSQEAGPFYCFREDGSQYQGAPVEGLYDKIDTGFVPATTRVMLGLDIGLTDSLSAFGKAGYVFGTGPTPDGLAESLKFHAEAGLKLWLTSSGAFPTEGLGVYVAGSGGLGQVDAKKNVPVQERTDVTTRQPNPPGQQVDAWAKYGQGFGALGVGFFYPLGPGAVMLDLRGMYMLPSSGFVAAPALGYGIGL
ncbi:MAG: hypothetical protein H6718_10005 [Polyangiaceae bacterium]|nr:hypothetical protein [Polyangiaceae bacterium]MCB9607348.1 hypothetical protein [Polyangiaceae bacterium]